MKTGTSRFPGQLLLVSFLFLCATQSVIGDQVVIEMELQLPVDDGQALGTLFELRNSDGQLVCAAGFPWSFSSRVIGQNRNLDFWCKSKFAARSKPVGKPSLEMTRVAISVDREGLVALGAGKVLSQKKENWRNWEFQSKTKNLRPSIRFVESGNLDVTGTVQSIQQIGNEHLYFSYRGWGADARAIFRGEDVASIDIDLAAAIYFDGTLYFAPTSGGEVFSCSWRPGSDPCTNFKSVKYRGGYAYAFAVFQEKLWWGDSTGKLWRLNGKAAELMLNKGRGEFYSFALFGNNLLAGYYPTARIFSFDGESWSAIKFVENDRLIVPTTGEVRPYEVQSMTVFGGRLWIGLYPFGELLSTSSDFKKWDEIAIFQNQDKYSNFVPYCNESVENVFGKSSKTYKDFLVGGFVEMGCGDWARRISSLASYEGTLYASAGSMRGKSMSSAPSFIQADDLNNFGKIHAVLIDGVINAPINWNHVTTKLCFSISDSKIVAQQDQETIGRAKIRHSIPIDVLSLKPTFADGLYGKSSLVTKAVIRNSPRGQ